MGEKIPDALAQEILTRFFKEFKGLIEQLTAEQIRLEQRIRELEVDSEEYRKMAQRLYVQLHAKEMEADWADFDPKDYTLSFEDILAEVHKVAEEHNAS